MMMKSIIYKFLFLFYRYYDKGSTKNVAYFSAITALLMVLFLNVYSFLIFTKIDENYLTFQENTPRWQKYAVVLFIVLPIYWVMIRVFKKDDILKVTMDNCSIKRGYILAVAYITLSVAVLAWAGS
jgi:hypothetical protein